MSAAKYAEGTAVPVARSREQLQALLEKQGATEIGFFTGAGGQARVAFKLRSGVLYALEVPLIDRDAIRVPAGPWSTREDRRERAVAAEQRRRWRALLLVVKAKLEAVASGISTMEGEFLASIVLANGRLLVDEIRPRLHELVASGRVPSLLPEGAPA